MSSFKRLLKVSYNANGGTGSIDDQLYETASFTTASNSFSRSGYTFMGWNTKADGSGTDYSAGQSVTVDANSSDLTLYAQWQSNKPFAKGDGSKNNPYIISNNDEWKALASYLKYGGESSGKYWKLGNSFQITTMVGTKDKPFKGTFDGDGKTLTANISGTTYTAPFSFINGAAINNLTVAGTISASGQFMGGIAGNAEGTVTISGCKVSATLNSSVNGDGTHGGFIGISSANLTFTDCLFSGAIKGSNTTNCGGFVGWRNSSTINVNHCLNAGSMSLKYTDGCATLARNGVNGTLTNAYYVNSVDNTQSWSNQGTRVYTTLQNGTIDKTITLFGTTYYLGPVTISGINTSYDYTGSNITVNYSVKDGNTTLTQNTDYTVTITNTENKTVSVIKDPNVYTFTFTGKGSYTGSASVTTKVMKTLDGAGTANNPYIIKTLLDWESFAVNVSGGTDYSGKYVQLAADIKDVSSMAGADGKPFRGTFDGKGKTLTVSITGSEMYIAPFRYVDGATIKNLKVDGTITASGKCAAGIAGNGKGVKIDNCWSNVTIAGKLGASSDATFGGLVGDQNGSEATITNSLFTGKFTGTAYTSGGIIGYANNRVTMTNVLQAGDFSGLTSSTSASGTFGRNPGQITLTNCYYLNPFGESQGTAVTADQLKSGETAHALQDSQATDIWGQTLGDASITMPRLVAFGSDQAQKVFHVTFVAKYDNMFNELYSNSQLDVENASGLTDYNGSFVMNGNTVTGIITLSADATIKAVDYELRQGLIDGVYHILNVAGWNQFADYVINTDNTVNAVLDANISGVSTMVGTQDKPYCGTFDGNGKVLDVKMSDESAQGAAPFRYISGATIKNLKVTGTVSSGSQSHSAGLVGFAWDGTNTIENCWVSTNVTTQGYHGGVVGHARNATLIIRNTLYDGKLSDANSDQYVGGLQGWSDGNTLTLENSLFAGTCPASHFNPVGLYYQKGTMTATVNNVYYSATPTLTSKDNQAAPISGGASVSACQLTNGEAASLLQGEQETEYWVCIPSVGTLLKTWAESIAIQTVPASTPAPMMLNKTTKTYWGTLYVDSKYTVPDGVAVYTVTSVADGVLHVSRVADGGQVIPAGGYLISTAEQQSSLTFTLAADDAQAVEYTNAGFLGGSKYTALVSEPGYRYYILARKKYDNYEDYDYGFYWQNEADCGVSDGTAVKIPGGKAYIRLSISEASNAKGLQLMSDETTGIESSKFKIQSSKAYNLNGQRVGESYRGLVIVNGKKMIRK